MTSAVLVLPDAYREEGNAFAAEQGWGEDNFCVALSANAQYPATHWGCRADVGQSFVDAVENPSPENQPLVAELIYNFQDNVDPYTHWITTLTANGLAVIYPPET
jgi:hypothetical protein